MLSVFCLLLTGQRDGGVVQIHRQQDQRQTGRHNRRRGNNGAFRNTSAHLTHTWNDSCHSNCILQTIRFKSYLLSMGIANPVTRETHGSGTHYHMQLAKQLGDMLQAPLEVNHPCVQWTDRKQMYMYRFNSIYLFLGAWGHDGTHRGVLSG